MDDFTYINISFDGEDVSFDCKGNSEQLHTLWIEIAKQIDSKKPLAADFGHTYIKGTGQWVMVEEEFDD